MADAGRKAVWARCRIDVCGHRWVVVDLPMEIMKAANAMKRAKCPACGDARPYASVAPASGGAA
ncbi:MAG: hypothetical protein DI547_16680 [Sphingobium sp.]|nr:MAG: hypothetical protein DI547_16680 [Sphingobium sp.]